MGVRSMNNLKKMYDADELTEESEEIVLKRALNDLNAASADGLNSATRQATIRS